MCNEAIQQKAAEISHRVGRRQSMKVVSWKSEIRDANLLRLEIRCYYLTNLWVNSRRSGINPPLISTSARALEDGTTQKGSRLANLRLKLHKPQITNFFYSETDRGELPDSRQANVRLFISDKLYEIED